jgi:beta-phosphoglucomutase-like phosphatase (HAD superfamily)
MIKAIIFDLDGVLVDTKAIHFKSLNKALKKYENYIIPFEDHSAIYDGLPTKKKLEILMKIWMMQNITYQKFYGEK